MNPRQSTRTVFGLLIASVAAFSANADLLVHLGLDNNYANSGTGGATFDGTAPGAITFVAGKLGPGISLPGDGSFIQVGGDTNGVTPILGNAARTVSVWVNNNATTLVTPISFGQNGTGTKWDFDIDGVAANGNGRIEVGAGSGRTVAGVGPAVNDGNWHLMTVALGDGLALASAQFYVDGEFVYDGGTVNRTINTADFAFYVGAAVNSPGFQSYAGLLDDVAVWNAALDSVRVRSLFGLGDLAGVNALGADSLFASFDGPKSDVLIGSTTWIYQATGLGGLDGQVLDLGAGNYSLNLGGGAGFTTVPEPSAMVLLALGGLALFGWRRKRN